METLACAWRVSYIFVIFSGSGDFFLIWLCFHCEGAAVRRNLLLHHNRGMGCVSCGDTKGKWHQSWNVTNTQCPECDCPPYLSFQALACAANQKQPTRRKKCPAVLINCRDAVFPAFDFLLHQHLSNATHFETFFVVK